VTGVDPSHIDERKQVLGDELRMFALAISRARRRVLLAAVANDDEAPSMFFGLVPPGAQVLDASGSSPLSLRGATGQLRRRLVAEGTSAEWKQAAASSLAALEAEGIPGASPRDWHGLIPLSSTGPLYDVAAGEKVPVSPSNLERLAESPLDWFLEKIAGGESGVVANVGTILHWAMETTENPTVDALWRAVESRWSELLFDAPWLAERQKRIARVFTEALGEYLADFAAQEHQLVGAERRFELAIDDAVVSGSIDRVERKPDGSVVIVDLKTGTPIASQQKIDDHAQLGAYQLAYAEGILDEALAEFGEHTGGGAKLLFVKKGLGQKLYREGIQAQLTLDQLEEFRERIRAAAGIIARAEFEGRVELGTFGLGDIARLRIHRVKAVSSD
ncbi:MAG: hypothetical protein QOI02_1801, partial [Actinomycetota bacterium]|nr:hypothetical protein [Actinomycetota bacterium]